MSGFLKRSVDTVNPAGGVNPATQPNVGQYGWTKYEVAGVNQLIQYVDMCKQYAQESKDAAEYVALRFIELQDFMTFITKVYEEIAPIYQNIIPIYEDIKVRHADIATRHADIIRLHGLVQVDAASAKDAAANALVSQNTSTVSANNAKASETNAAKSAKDAADIAEELRKGQVYRGTWNIEGNNAFPPKPDTNSVWDITLNEDSTEFFFAGEKWFWGDRLLYLKDDDQFSQIESGSTVISVNGKGGAVQLNADDVGAVTKHEWNATVKLGAWSTICQLNHTKSYAGKAILTVGMTRGNFVHNSRFLVSWGHAGHAAITQLESHGYSQIKVRVGIVVADQCIFSILDTDYTTTPEGTEVIYACQIDELYGAAQLFTGFTLDDGTASITDTVTTEYRAIKIGNNKVYHQGFLPTAPELNVVNRDGDSMKGSLRAALGRKSAIQLEDKASIVYRDGSASWFHNFSEGNILRWNIGQNSETEVAALRSSGEFITGAFNSTGNGISLKTVGGYIESKPSYTRLHGDTYSFVTSPYDAHLCYNSYWDGSDWKKYRNEEPSGHVVINNQGLRFMSSDAGHGTPLQHVHQIYHEGRKPSPAEIGALSLGGGSMHDRGEIHWPQSGASLMSRDTQFVSLEGGVHTIVTTGRINADGASYIGRNFYYEGGWKKFNNAKDSGMLEVSGSGMTFYQSDAGSDDVTQKQYKIYHEGFKPSAADFGGVPVYGVARTGTDISALKVLSIKGFASSGSCTFSFLISGGNNFGGNQVPLFKVSVNNRGDTGSGPINPSCASVTQIEGSDPSQMDFFLIRNGVGMDFWITRPTYSSQLSVIPLVNDETLDHDYPIEFATGIPSGERVQIPVSKTFTTSAPPSYVDVGALPVNHVSGTPVAAYLTSAENNAIGTKIRLPFKTDSSAMVTFTVRVYQNYAHTDVQFSGYLYATPNQWYSPKATMISGSTSLRVKMGKEDNGFAYVWVEGNAYRGVAVIDVVAGYHGGDWNSGWEISITDEAPNVVYEDVLYPPYSKNNLPVLSEIGAFPVSGGQMAGSIVTPNGLKSAIDVADKASILFRDGSNSLMHQSANGNAIVWGHGASGEHYMADLNVNGAWNTLGAQYGTHHIAKSRNNTTWLGIESSEELEPYISFQAPGMASAVKGISFTNQEFFSWRSLASEHFRVATDAGLKFSPDSNLSGITWGVGINPDNRSIGFHTYTNGAWTSAPLQIASNGTTTISGATSIGGGVAVGGSITTSGIVDVKGGYLKTERGTNPMVEWHAPGKHAWISYVPDEGGLVMGPSNGSGALSTPGVHFTAGANNFTGRINVAQHQGRAWTGMGVAAFHNTQTDVGEGALHGLVTGKYHFAGSHILEMGLGNIHSANSAASGHTLWTTDGGGYTKIWQFNNAGTLSSPEHWSIGTTGMLNGTVWGGNLNTWIATYYAPISDATMKRNIKPSTKSALEDVSKIDFVSYDWDETNPLSKDKKSPKIGLTAQQMEEIDSCYSRDIETFKEDGSVETSVKALDVTNILSLALKAIQELEAKVAQLEEKLNESI